MIKGMTVTNRGNKLTLILGLTLGLVAAVLTFVYLSSSEDSGSKGGSTSSGGDTPVVVAVQDIPSGTRITPEMITLKTIPGGDALVGYFNSVDAAVNQVTLVSFVPGEQIIQAKVTGSDAAIGEFGDNPPIALVVKDGMRAVSVQVSSLIGAGGLIRPGDYVDVILTVKTEASTEGSDVTTAGKNQIAATVVQNVMVLAMDQTISRTASGAPEDEKDNNPEATTVTLAVSPIQGEVLALADMCGINFDGRLALAARRIGDAARITTREEWPADGRFPDCATLFGLTSLP